MNYFGFQIGPFKLALEPILGIIRIKKNSYQNRKSLLDMDIVRFSLALCVFGFRRYRLRRLILR